MIFSVMRKSRRFKAGVCSGEANTRLFFLIATWGKLTPENAKFIVIKSFFEKIFCRIFTTKKHSKERKILCGNNGRHFGKNLDAMRFLGC